MRRPIKRGSGGAARWVGHQTVRPFHIADGHQGCRAGQARKVGALRAPQTPAGIISHACFSLQSCSCYRTLSCKVTQGQQRGKAMIDHTTATQDQHEDRSRWFRTGAARGRRARHDLLLHPYHCSGQSGCDRGLYRQLTALYAYKVGDLELPRQWRRHGFWKAIPPGPYVISAADGTCARPDRSRADARAASGALCLLCFFGPDLRPSRPSFDILTIEVSMKTWFISTTRLSFSPAQQWPPGATTRVESKAAHLPFVQLHRPPPPWKGAWKASANPMQSPKVMRKRSVMSCAMHGCGSPPMIA